MTVIARAPQGIGNGLQTFPKENS